MQTTRSFSDNVGGPDGGPARVLILNNKGQCISGGVSHGSIPLKQVVLSELEHRRKLAPGSLNLSEAELREVAEIVSWIDLPRSTSAESWSSRITVQLK